jgi:hypothetical protein
VGRLELGEVNPSMETLMRVSAQLGIEFTIDVRPAGTPVHNVTKRAQANNLVGSFPPTRPRFSWPRDRSTLLLDAWSSSAGAVAASRAERQPVAWAVCAAG